MGIEGLLKNCHCYGVSSIMECMASEITIHMACIFIYLYYGYQCNFLLNNPKVQENIVYL